MNFQETVTQRQPKKLSSLGDGRFKARLAEYENGWRAVVKTVNDVDSKALDRQEGDKERFLGLPVETYPYREVAFYALSKILGWEDLVPETALATVSDVTASAQMFVPSIYIRDIAPDALNKKKPNWLEAFIDVSKKFPRDSWRRIILMDLIAGNRDRHAKNIIVKYPGPKPIAIDNSVTFGFRFDRYRNIFHKYLFPKSFNFIPYRDHLRSLERKDFDPLSDYLKPLEVDHAWRRLQFILEFPYRLPYNVLSRGAKTSSEFPSYKDYFLRRPGESERQPLVLQPPPGERGDDTTSFRMLSGDSA